MSSAERTESCNLPHDEIRSARNFVANCDDAASRLACIAVGITGQRDNAEDIVQQAIAIAIEKDPGFETREQFMAWLVGIVKNCALNYRRKKIRRRTHASNPAGLANIETNQPVDQPIDHATGDLLPLQQSFDDRVKSALLKLNPDARCCLLLRSIEQLSYKEISLLMQIPQGTAMNMVHRSKKTLRELLSVDTDDKTGEAGSGVANG